MLKRFAIFLSIFQTILFLAHFFLYQTLIYAFEPPGGIRALAITLSILSICFLSASLLGFRYFNFAVRMFYTLAAIWLGIFNYLAWASFAWWAIYGVLTYADVEFSSRTLGTVVFGIALATGVYGLLSASWTRVRRITVRLAGLPNAWKGRTIALVSDLHLGNVRNEGFARSIVRKIAAEKPAMVIVAGDLFDGTPLDADRAVAPLRDLRAPLGAFFTEGNHEEFSDPAPYLAAIKKTGIRVLDNEILDIDGLQLLGVPYRQATHAEHLRSVFAKMDIDRRRASLLITHAPDNPRVAEEAGISLQVSGHTHRGQFFPYTWIAGRIYRQFVYGLSRIGGLQVYTSSGAGTWGPPLRVGAPPEIVMLQIEQAEESRSSGS